MAAHTHFKRQNTVDSATIKESRQAARSVAAGAGDSSDQPSSLPSPAGKPRALRKSGSPTTARTIGPSGGRRTQPYGVNTRPVSASAEPRTPSSVTQAGEIRSVTVRVEVTPG